MINKTKINKAALRKSNLKLKRTILLLKKQKNEFWNYVAKLLARPRKKTIQVNLDKINKFGKETVLVPGKILSKGELQKKLTISAFRISEKAREKIKEAGSTYIDIEDILKKNPEAKGIKIII